MRCSSPAGGLLVAVAFRVRAGKYPSRTVEVVPYARRRHGQPDAHDHRHHRRTNGRRSLNVVNRAGGSGAVGFNYHQQERRCAHHRRRDADDRLRQDRGRLPGNHRDAMTILMIVAIDELLLSVRSESPYKTIDDFVKAAKAKPGSLTIGGTATLTEDHIFTYLFEKAAGISVKYVPFNSGGEVTTALMGGHIDAAVENPNEIVSQIEAGKARHLAVAAQKRLKDAPDVPTFAEKGYKFYWEQMRGVVGPANMPPEAVKWWQDTLKKWSPPRSGRRTTSSATCSRRPTGPAIRRSSTSTACTASTRKR